MYKNRKVKLNGSAKNIQCVLAKKKVQLLLTLVFQFFLLFALGQPGVFVDITEQQFNGLPQLGNSSSAWGDYDKDGRPDLLICGLTNDVTVSVTKLYHNTTAGFVDVSNLAPGLPQVSSGSVSWGDYDHDGKLDFFVCGDAGGGNAVSKLFHNTGNGFEDKSGVVQGLLPFYRGTAALTDWNKDGFADLSVVAMAFDSVWQQILPCTRFYVSDADSLYDVSAYLVPNAPQVLDGMINWYDYDNDGWPDMMISGNTGSSGQTWLLHNNRGLSFTDKSNLLPGLPSLMNTAVGWADYSKDGRPDLAITGQNANGQYFSMLYQNKSEFGFTETTTTLPDMQDGSMSWGDYDNDGRPDLLMMGYSGSTPTSRLYHNTASGFVDVSSLLPGLPQVHASSAAWADYDKDGRLDVIMIGDEGTDEFAGKLYHNTGSGFEDKTDLLTETQTFYPAMADGKVAWVFNSEYGTNDLMIIGFSREYTDLNDTKTTPMMLFYTNMHFGGGSGFRNHTGLYPMFPPLQNSDMDWGDYDNDGWVDVMIIGQDGKGAATSVLFHAAVNPEFEDKTSLLPGLPKLYNGNVSWGDYDHDGWLDLIVTGVDDSNNPHTILYHNLEGKAFEDASSLLPDLPQVSNGTVAWGDYDSDGKLDLFISGDDNNGAISRLYHYQDNAFVDVSTLLANLPQVDNSSAAWVDIDNNGTQDLILMGQGPSSAVTKLYMNTGNILYADVSSQLPDLQGLASGSVNWGDYDNDGNIDLLLSGTLPTYFGTSLLYRNTGNGFENKSYLLPTVHAALDAPLGVRMGAVQWIDFDNKGRLGLFMTGQNSAGDFTSNLLGNISPDLTSLLPGLPGLSKSSVGWGDYDNDGKLDLFVMGMVNDNVTVSKLYHNLGNGFEDASASLPGLPQLAEGDVAWGDYDNDGRLDLIISGSALTTFATKLYHNTGTGFEDVSGKLPLPDAIAFGKVSWFDYDSDGLTDLMIMGSTGNGDATFLYHNTGTGFEDATSLLPELPKLEQGSIAWGDYDNDGKPDLYITGYATGTGNFAALYHNTGQGFEVNDDFYEDVNVAPLSQSSAQWGDYNHDGWLDLMITGQDDDGNNVTKLLINYSGFFDDESYVFPNLPSLFNGDLAWADFDSDGLLDLILTGQTSGGAAVFKLYRNADNNQFRDETSRLADVLPAVSDAALAWGDYDNDGKPDLIITGNTGSAFVSILMHNPWPSANTPPTAPPGLAAVPAEDLTVKLSWQAATDQQTPPGGLSYNLYISDSPNGQNILSSMSNTSNGFRRVVKLGNSQARTYTIQGLEHGKIYYWSVQAIDAGFTGSVFAPVQQFLTDSAQALPAILFDNVNATNAGDSNRIYWNTLYEEEGSRFEVEKLYSHSTPRVIGVHQAKGSPSQYEIFDPEAKPGRHTYRVKIYHSNGSFKTSELVSVYVQGDRDFTIEAYPNPVKNKITINLQGSISGMANLSLVNSNGQTILHSRVTGNQMTLDLSGLIPGIYFIKYQDARRNESKQILKH